MSNFELLDEDACVKCGEEVDIFGGIIDDELWCARCCAPLKEKWYREQRVKNE